MCDPITTTLLAGAAGSGIAGAFKSMLNPPKPPAAPQAPAAPPAPQAAKDPNIAALRANNATTSGPQAGYASTLLTGPTGVAASTLNIGKNTLLGGA